MAKKQLQTEEKIYARPGRQDRKRTELSILAAMYDDIERLRVSHQVRLSHLKLDKNKFADNPIFTTVLKELAQPQHTLDKVMAPYVKTHATWTQFNVHVKGVGLHLLALVLGHIRDITPFTNVSKLWWLCGLAVVDGKAQRPVKGEPLNYNAKLKSILLGRVGSQFLKNADPFARSLYDEYRAEYEKREPKGAHTRALRKVVKLWVACLWSVWRESEGLPVTPHYAQSVLGHTSPPITWQSWVEFNQRSKLNGKVKHKKTAE